MLLIDDPSRLGNYLLEPNITTLLFMQSTGIGRKPHYATLARVPILE